MNPRCSVCKEPSTLFLSTESTRDPFDIFYSGTPAAYRAALTSPRYVHFIDLCSDCAEMFAAFEVAMMDAKPVDPWRHLREYLKAKGYGGTA